MPDISLLMASVLTTGQTTVPELPEELPEQPENTQQQLEQNQESSVVISSEIAPPDFIKSDNTLEAINEECDRNNCQVSKQSQRSRKSSLQLSNTVITPIILNLENKNILAINKNKIQFKDSFSSIEEAQKTVPPQKSNLEAFENNASNLIPSKPKLIPNQFDNQKDSLITQKPEPEFDTDSQELASQNIFPNSGTITANKSLESENPMSQVTSVSELDDVSPTDWAFEALQSLASRHNCALGYPDGTFRGKRIINRYQFATGIDACLGQINELIARNGASAVDEQDLIILQRLQNEFRAELNQLEERIISLEERTGELQANRFSPTTRFFGQVTTSLQGTNTNEVDLFPRDGVPERTAQTNLTFANSMQITLATSFTGRDLLLTGLYAGNLGSSASSLFTNMGRLNFESDTGNDVLINDLSYRFPISNNLGVVVGAAGVNPTSTFRGINSLEGEAISSFAQRNPIIGIGSGSGGVGFDWQINNRISLQGVYSSQFPSFPTDKNVGGLFGGRQTLGTQLTVTPVNDIDVGLNYLYSRSPDSLLATGVGDAQLTSPFAPDTAFDTQAIGATVAYRISPNFQIGGWGGWTFSDPKDIQGSVTTNNWGVFAAFPNLGQPGNLGGIIVGQPPKITSSTLPDGFNFPNFSNSGTPGGRDGTSLHVEMFYRAKLNRNLDITPGFFVVFNPDHNQSNDPLIVGALKATFRF
ncbi:putative S-layer protein [Rivularia sp. PCC 7116]|uniref:iron uptake porin n=1 Tax=Rivularia sp. PCC 7116 TaxID=373994 RepID=UPI00029F1A15|nr:iron uptake porin [Rivularia sp. PCC 7116]AFY53782.1 putative S-layer protein [Rivularia sp. PCC 7116]